MRSRWYAGVSTFGPAGRLAFTGLVLGLPLLVLVWAVVTTGEVGLLLMFPLIFVWLITGARLALKDIWAKDAFYVPVPLIPTTQQLIDLYGTRVPTMEQFVAGQDPLPDPASGS